MQEELHNLAISNDELVWALNPVIEESAKLGQYLWQKTEIAEELGRERRVKLDENAISRSTKSTGSGKMRTKEVWS